MTEPTPDTETRIWCLLTQDADGAWVADVCVGEGDEARVHKYFIRQTKNGATKAAQQWADEYRNTPRTANTTAQLEL